MLMKATKNQVQALIIRRLGTPRPLTQSEIRKGATQPKFWPTAAEGMGAGWFANTITVELHGAPSSQKHRRKKKRATQVQILGDKAKAGSTRHANRDRAPRYLVKVRMDIMHRDAWSSRLAAAVWIINDGGFFVRWTLGEAARWVEHMACQVPGISLGVTLKDAGASGRHYDDKAKAKALASLETISHHAKTRIKRGTLTIKTGSTGTSTSTSTSTGTTSASATVINDSGTSVPLTAYLTAQATRLRAKVAAINAKPKVSPRTYAKMGLLQQCVRNLSEAADFGPFETAGGLNVSAQTFGVLSPLPLIDAQQGDQSQDTSDAVARLAYNTSGSAGA